tara:strand:- start:4632 stop:4907 length:276 start_codon:yes stop_codon:yes gene_type:complete
MAEMMEAKMNVEISYKRDEPHASHGREFKITYYDVGVLLLPESSPTEDYTKDEIVKMVFEHSASASIMATAGWQIDKVEVTDYDVTGHDEY